MLIDVGGQRSERKKWIHCFDNVTAVLFVAAISEFDEVLYEDGQTNRVAESLALFGQIINSRWFRSTPIILFLNKIDILKRKIASGKSLTEYYPEFNGDPGSVSDVLSFMKNRFLIANLSSSRQIYVHETCATDTKSMEYVMAAVTDMVFEKNLIWSGLL
jgi:guanine nucleotide-binding protein subunit alpha